MRKSLLKLDGMKNTFKNLDIELEPQHQYM